MHCLPRVFVCTQSFSYVFTHDDDRTLDSPSARNSKAPSPCFLCLSSDYESGGENESARQGASRTRNQQFRNVSTFLWLFPTTSFYRPLDFPMGVFSEHHKFAYHPTCHLLFPARSAGCKRQRRGTKYGLAEKVGGRNRRGTCVFRKFPRCPMCKYLSGVSGPARLAVCACTIALQHSHTHALVRIHGRDRSTRGSRSMHRGVVWIHA